MTNDEKVHELQLSDILMAVQNENARLRGEVTSLKTCQNRAEYAERFVEDLKSENAKLRAELATTTEKLANLEAVCADPQHWLALADARHEKDQAELAAAKKDLFLAHEGLDERDKLRAELAAAKANADAWAKSANWADERLRFALQELAAAEATIAELATDGNAITLAANLAKVSQELAAARKDRNEPN